MRPLDAKRHPSQNMRPRTVELQGIRGVGRIFQHLGSHWDGLYDSAASAASAWNSPRRLPVRISCRHRADVHQVELLRLSLVEVLRLHVHGRQSPLAFMSCQRSGVRRQASQYHAEMHFIIEHIRNKLEVRPLTVRIHVQGAPVSFRHLRRRLSRHQYTASTK